MSLQNINPYIIVGGLALLAIIVVGIWWLLTRKKDKMVIGDDSQATAKPITKVLCYVSDIKARTKKVMMISTAELADCFDKYKSYGRQWNYLGKDVFALQKNENKYNPIMPTETMDEPPSKLHRALQQDDTEIIYDMTVEQSMMAKYGWFFAVIGISAFLIIASWNK